MDEAALPWDDEVVLQKGRFAKVAEEVHAAYLLEKWTKIDARNQKRFTVAVVVLTVVELDRLGTKPKEALPRKYGAEMFEISKYGSVRRIFTGWNAVVWPDRFRKVGYYYEMEKEVFNLKPHGRPLLSQVE